MKTSLVNFRYFDISRYSFMTHLPGPNLKVPKFSKNYGNTWKLVFPFKGIWEYLNILDFLGATQTESLTVFRDLFHDPSSGAQPKCTTAVWWGKILMKMTMALNCPIFTITATSMSSIMGRNPILKENTNFDTLQLCAKKYWKFRFYLDLKWQFSGGQEWKRGVATFTSFSIPYALS